ncbi:transposase [Streptomyces violascens]|uniref:transposase n=1 Tax=Streptomyces violascens TaxID=67381 RepID=UPI003678A04E
MPGSRTVKTSADVHREDQGTDAGKRIVGLERDLGCDALGLLLVVLVTAAGICDTAAGATLLSRSAAAHSRLRKAWVDAGYRTTTIEHSSRYAW